MYGNRIICCELLPRLIPWTGPRDVNKKKKKEKKKKGRVTSRDRPRHRGPTTLVTF